MSRSDIEGDMEPFVEGELDWVWRTIFIKGVCWDIIKGRDGLIRKNKYGFGFD